MMSSKLLKSNAKPTWMEERVEHTLGKVNRVYEYMLDLVMLNRKSMLAFAVVIFSTLPFLFNSLSSELTPNEDKGAFIAIGNAPSSVNVDYIQKCNATIYEKCNGNTRSLFWYEHCWRANF